MLKRKWLVSYLAEVLKDHDLITNYYHPLIDDEWSAISNYIKIDKEIYANSLYYCISGNENQVKLKQSDIWSEERGGHIE